MRGLRCGLWRAAGGPAAPSVPARIAPACTAGPLKELETGVRGSGTPRRQTQLLQTSRRADAARARHAPRAGLHHDIFFQADLEDGVLHGLWCCGTIVTREAVTCHADAAPALHTTERTRNASSSSKSRTASSDAMLRALQGGPALCDPTAGSVHSTYDRDCSDAEKIATCKSMPSASFDREPWQSRCCPESMRPRNRGGTWPAQTRATRWGSARRSRHTRRRQTLAPVGRTRASDRCQAVPAAAASLLSDHEQRPARTPRRLHRRKRLSAKHTVQVRVTKRVVLALRYAPFARTQALDAPRKAAAGARDQLPKVPSGSPCGPAHDNSTPPRLPSMSPHNRSCFHTPIPCRSWSQSASSRRALLPRHQLAQRRGALPLTCQFKRAARLHVSCSRCDARRCGECTRPHRRLTSS